MTPNHHDQLEQATAARLARLGARPVDVSGLQQRVMRELDALTAPTSVAAQRPWQRWWRPITSAAAAIIIALASGWFMFNASATPAIAAPMSLAQIHYDVANGLTPHLKVSNVDEANRLLAAQSSGAIPVPELPAPMHACCLNEIDNVTLTCALIERAGQLITVAVAHGGAMHSPDGETVTRNGKTFTLHAANGINMVMTHHDNRWLCVMGEASNDDLLAVALEIEF